MKFFFVLFFSIIGTTLIAQQTIINDKNVQVRQVSTFAAIKVSGGIDVYLSQADDYSLAVSAADDKYLENIKTEVSDGILVISYANDRTKWNAGDKRLRVYVSFKNIESLEASGACDFIITGNLNVENLVVKLSGASDIKGPLKITNLNIEMTGASTAKINGAVQNLNLTAGGASDLKNYDLIIDNCVAKISGASDVRFTVKNSISGTASGASSLHYEGNPEKKDIATSGASSFSQRN